MKSKISLSVAALIATLGIASFASAADQRMSFVGGHNPAQLVRIEPSSANAPYALTGSQMGTQKSRVQSHYIGSRFVGVQQIGN